MARCPKLETKDVGFLTGTTYYCELTGVEMDDDNAKIKHLCYTERGYEYENCPIYKDR